MATWSWPSAGPVPCGRPRSSCPGRIGWLVASPIQKAFGRLIDQTGSFDTGITLAGLAPAVAIAVIMIFWPHTSSAAADST